MALLALAVFGGYTLYDRYQSNSGDCRNAVAWHREAVQRNNNAVLRASELNPSTMTNSDARTEAIHFENLAAAQRDSDPPPAGSEFNAAMVLYYEMMAET